jgi:RNA polymerase sigma-70 factor (ECF subfamily)
VFLTSLNEDIACQWTKSIPAVAAYIRATVTDFHDAQDILQNVSIAVVRKYRDYDNARPFVAWVIGIARNEILHYRRRVGTDPHVFDDSALKDIAEAFIAHADEVHPLMEAMEKCLAKLPSPSRQLLESRYVNEMDYKQMAEATRSTIPAIKASMFRIREALRKCIRRQIRSSTEGLA